MRISFRNYIHAESGEAFDLMYGCSRGKWTRKKLLVCSTSCGERAKPSTSW